MICEDRLANEIVEDVLAKVNGRGRGCTKA